MKTKIKVYDWTELHETNLNGVLDPSMMTHEGKVTTVALSRLKKQGTRGVSPEPRQVYFDRRFIRTYAEPPYLVGAVREPPLQVVYKLIFCVSPVYLISYCATT